MGVIFAPMAGTDLGGVTQKVSSRARAIWGPPSNHRFSNYGGGGLRLTSRGNRRACKEVSAVLQVDATPGASERVADASVSTRSTGTTSFNWAKQWYPMAYVQDLESGRPHPVQLLGKDLVLWRDGEGAWRCFEDRCPHRLAPLSEGRIEQSTGNLMCSYHGWEFKGDGGCASIPQAIDPFAAKVATGSPRACATPHPTQVLQGLVWVWGSAGPHALAESAASSPALIPEFERTEEIRVSPSVGERVIWLTDTFMRDVPYSWETGAENLLDPAHIHFAHHGVIGSRQMPTSGHVIMTQLPEQLPASIPRIDAPGISFAMSQPSFFAAGRVNKQVLSLVPPANIRWHIPDLDDAMERDAAAKKGPDEILSELAAIGKRARKNGSSQLLNFYCTPTAPGRMRIFAHIGFFSSGKGTLPWFVENVLSRMPRWMTHLDAHDTLDGDNMLLHYQGHILAKAERAGQPWSKAFYLPTSSDAAVVALRQWLGRVGPPTPPPDSGPDPRQEVIINRYEQHTKNCAHCLRALRSIKLVRVVAIVVGLLAAGGGALQAAQRAGWVPLAATLGIAALSTAVAFACSAIIPKFYFVGYSHPTRN